MNYGEVKFFSDEVMIKMWLAGLGCGNAHCNVNDNHFMTLSRSKKEKL